MASRVRKPSPNAADARRQRYARAHENAQRGKGDSRTQSHTYDVERGSVQSSPQRPQQYRLDAQDGSGLESGQTVQPGAGMFYQAQQAAMLQGQYRMPGMAPPGQGSMSAMPAGTGDGGARRSHVWSVRVANWRFTLLTYLEVVVLVLLMYLEAVFSQAANMGQVLLTYLCFSERPIWESS